MSKRGNVAILIGVLIILAAGGYFVLFSQVHTPSPFDVVDDEEENKEFIPLVVPFEIEDGLDAPTLEEKHPESDRAEKVTGLVPDRLVIPILNLDAPIVAVHYKDIESGGKIYHQWRVPLEFAAGWQDESALLGVPGNTVLNGHHNAYGMVFKDLVKLGEGALILVYSGESEFRYLVVDKLLLPELGESLEQRMENARWMLESSDERLTLVTCWPADSNTHRVVIIAFPDYKVIP